MKFTGGDNLTGFKKLINDIFMRNELYNGDGGYAISHARAGRSGYSFGPVQWDPSTGHIIEKGNTPEEDVTAESLLRGILKNAKDSAGNAIVSDSDTLAKNASTQGSTLSDSEIAAINAALSSDHGVQAINDAYLAELDTKVARIDALVAELRGAGREQAADFIENNHTMQLLLIDYDNQFGIDGIDVNGHDADGKMLQFLKGEEVHLEGVSVELDGDLDLGDFGNFVFQTKYAVTKDLKTKRYGFEDLVRRYSHVLAVAGENGLLPDNSGGLGAINPILPHCPVLSRPHPLSWLIPAGQGADGGGFPPWLDPFNNAKKLISPIVLDLDGDDVETRGLQNGVFFDHDANGFAQQSGWVGPDDGLLAWDRNNDGQINDGRELFGNGTVLQNGSNAANGFAALDDLDVNRDGKIDANDAAWVSLRVWKDTNRDAHTDAGELLSLSDAGIQSIGTSYRNSTAIDAQGNEHRQVGSFTRTDGSTATATDVWFDENAAISHANEEVDVSADIAALPDAAGYGVVYSLHQAMARDGSGALKTLVQSFVAETNSDARRSLVEQILLKWTGSEGIASGSRGGYIDGGKLAVLEKFAGQTWSYDNSWAWYPGQVGPSAAAALTSAYDSLVEQVYGQLVTQSHLQDLWSRITLRWDEPTQSLKADLSAVIAELQSRLTTDPVTGMALLGEFARSVHALQAEELVDFPAFREVFAVQGADLAWVLDSGGKTVIQGGAGNDTISGSGGNDVLYGDEGDDSVAGGFGNDILDGGAGNDTLNGGGGDVVWWATNGNDTYLFGRGSGQDTITDYDTTAASDVDTIVFKPGIAPSDISINRSGNDLVLSINDTTDQLTVKDYFYGETNLYSASWLSTKELNPYKIEKIKFADGTVWNYEDLTSETINGTGGADSLYGYDGKDQLNGLDGNDDLHGGTGDDVLDGGAGNDTLDGGVGNDTYVFSRGFGQDVISDNDPTQGNIDTVAFGPDITPADVHVTHDTQNVYLTIDGSMDRVKLSNWLASDAYKIEQVKFSDGTVWNRTTLFAKAMEPGDGADRLFGDGEDNVLRGLGGDDTLHGQDGNDTLMGGADNDTLDGGTGADTLDGGAGVDTMNGGAGSDTYVFNRGYGRDTISDWDGRGSDIDVVQFGSDIAPSDVCITRDAYHLYLQVNGTSDRLTLSNYFHSTAYRIDQVKFADGTLWTDLESRITWADPTPNADTVYGSLRDDAIDGLEGNDALYGNAGNDTLSGGGGADVLFGGAGDDTLDGGAGNDVLNGGESYYGYGISNGKDTYSFGRGSGQDVILDNDVTAGNRDTVQMALDVLPSDVRVTRDYQNLYLSINGTTDRLTLQSWFVDDAHKVEQVRFPDGTLWDISTLVEKSRISSEVDDTLIGNGSDDVINGLGGDDLLDGQGGNDTLDGGAGDDTLLGGTGADTYRFGRGYGQDVITEVYETTAGVVDTVQLYIAS